MAGDHTHRLPSRAVPGQTTDQWPATHAVNENRATRPGLGSPRLSRLAVSGPHSSIAPELSVDAIVAQFR